MIGTASRLGVAVRAILLTAALATTMAEPAAAEARSGVPRAAGRQRAHAAVIGGQPAAPGTFPWMAYVLDLRGNTIGQCSGTVVAPNLILTAGHCAENMQTGVANEASGYRVMTGNLNSVAPETESQASGVSRVIPCPCHDRHTAVGDVALLQLSTPTTAPAVTLAASPRGGTAALLAGWGVTYYNQQTQVEQLRWASTVIQSSGSCEREAPSFSPTSEICTLDPPARKTGGCNGDSGGPLLAADSSAVGAFVQIGVASHVYGKCATTKPSVFTRVDAVSAWVRGWVQALAASPPTSASLPVNLIATPTLAGLADSRAVSIGSRGISLVLTCDGEGGVCAGDVAATITVRERLVLHSNGRQRTVSTRILKATLAKVEFALAPGASTVVQSELSPQSRALLSRLGGRPLEVLLSGRGIASHVATLELSSRR